MAMSGEPIVSVITPFLNAERFIAEAIESVVAQRFQQWELLLVDDGSADRSTRIARAAAARDARIRYLEHAAHANLGKSSSRNLGIVEARGRYITFLDADDVFLHDKLSHQVGLLDARPGAVMAYGTTEYWFNWDPNASSVEPDRLGKLGVAPDRHYLPPALLVAFLRDPGIVPCICALLARRDAALATGCFDESVQNLYEDQVFIVKMVLHGAVFVDSGCGERYRQHADSSSAVAERAGRYHPTQANEARHVFLGWVEDYVRGRLAANRELDRALKAALRPYRHPRFDRLLRSLAIFSGRS
jgi:glycosyltransferase involved in cell wall biosynthesis